MKTKTRKNSLVGFIAVFLALTLTLSLTRFVSQGFTAIAQKINYQGYLTNASGVPVNGTVQMTFVIYDVPTGGTVLWSETHNVTVSRGVYNVTLGEGSPPSPLNLPFDVQYYLGIAVGADPEMTPRIPLTSVGYAFRAQTVESVGSHTHSGADITTGTVSEPRIDSAIARTSDLNAHTSNTNNPHSTTAAQVGAAPAVHAHSGGDITSGTVSEPRIDSAIARTSALTGHTSNTNNPHSTTAAQVGAVALNQANTITSGMIVDGAVTDAKITGPISGSKISSTGLDADTLDTLHASAFALAGHNHDAAYVNQAGDTMSGTLAVSVGGSSSAVSGATTGTANAGNFQINNPSNTVSALYSTTNGSGPAVYGLATGTGRAGVFQINNASSTVPALVGITNATSVAVAGNTTGTGHAGYFQINNASNSVAALYATTNGTGAAGYFDGNVVVAGNLAYGAPKTRYWTVRGKDFIPANSGITYIKDLGYLYAANGPFTAPVHLPDGAVITRLRIYFWDTSGTQRFWVALQRTDMLNNDNNMAMIVTTWDSTNPRTIETTTISSNTIDNSTYAYGLTVQNFDGTASHRFYGVLIEYTVTNPLP